MRFPLLVIAAAILLAVPTVLAAFHGGYGEQPRLAAAVVTWLLVAIAAVAAPAPLPRGVPGRLAIGGLAALLALTLGSLAWAPQAAAAYGDAERVALYLGTLIGGLALLRPPGVARWVVPALAAGAIAAVVVGLSERVAPWLVELERSPAAGGRLSAPLGYWNAMGALAAVAMVLCLGVAGDPVRAPRLRAAAAATAPLLGAGVALSFSRGAILAAAVGVAVVLVSRPRRSQVRSAAIVTAAAVGAGAVAVLLPDVGDLAAAESRRSFQGAVLAVVLVAGTAAAWAAQRAAAGREAAPNDRAAASRMSRPRLAVGAIVVLTVGAVAALAAETGPRSGDPAFGARAERLRSVQSNRYAYWQAAVETWADHPIAGAGSGAFAVEWLRRRTVAASARDAHSLPLETAAELGIAGLLALALLVAGAVAGVVRLHRLAPGVGAAAAGGLAAWSAHAMLDWAWEMPSLTLIALLLAAAVLATGEERHTAGDARSDRKAEPTAMNAATA